MTVIDCIFVTNLVFVNIYVNWVISEPYAKPKADGLVCQRSSLRLPLKSGCKKSSLFRVSHNQYAVSLKGWSFRVMGRCLAEVLGQKHQLLRQQFFFF